VHFLINAFDKHVHCIDADGQFMGDALVRMAFDQQVEDFRFPSGQSHLMSCTT